jgi:ankyrin repeat protein
VGNTALIIAAQNGNAELVEFLVEQEADINVKNQAGYTALGIESNRSVQNILKSHGAVSRRPNHYKNLFKQMLKKWMNI